MMLVFMSEPVLTQLLAELLLQGWCALTQIAVPAAPNTLHDLSESCNCTRKFAGQTVLIMNVNLILEILAVFVLGNRTQGLKHCI